MENEEEEVVIALYDFAGMEPHDLTLVMGEEYVILEKCDVHWYKARNKHGSVPLACPPAPIHQSNHISDTLTSNAGEKQYIHHLG